MINSSYMKLKSDGKATNATRSTEMEDILLVNNIRIKRNQNIENNYLVRVYLRLFRYHINAVRLFLSI